MGTLVAAVISESSQVTLSLVYTLGVAIAAIAGLWAIERQKRAQDSRDIEELRKRVRELEVESEACKLWRAEEMGARRGRHDSTPILIPPHRSSD